MSPSITNFWIKRGCCERESRSSSDPIHHRFDFFCVRKRRVLIYLFACLLWLLLLFFSSLSTNNVKETGFLVFVFRFSSLVVSVVFHIFIFIGTRSYVDLLRVCADSWYFFGLFFFFASLYSSLFPLQEKRERKFFFFCVDALLCRTNRMIRICNRLDLIRRRRKANWFDSCE